MTLLGLFPRNRVPAGQAARRRTSLAWSLALVLPMLQSSRARGEAHLDYRYELYQEDDDRIEVQTHSALFETQLKERLLSVKGEVIYDSISGATPTGAAPSSKYNYDFMSVYGFQPEIVGNTNGTAAPLTHMEDERKAMSLETPLTLGRHTITPQFAYSEESDYKSTGVALNYAVLLNEKNTTLSFGWAHTWDEVLDDHRQPQDKRSDDLLIGLNQLLGPKTVLGLHLTYGKASGYLNDPYRLIVAANDLQINADDPSGYVEHRPDEREKYIARLSLTQFITPCHASFEAAYRYFQDSYGTDAHTIEFWWHQKIGRHVVISPVLRYYHQTAADFYYDILPDSNNLPSYYSSDYRLSEMQTVTAGVNVMIKATKWLTFDASYRRYVMEGLDGVTAQSAYPSANVFSIGARFFF